MNSPVAVEAFFLPRCIYLPDHLHMLFNALEESVSSTPSWKVVEKHYKALAGFLNNNSLRGRFRALCMRRSEGHNMFKAWSVGGKFSWRWEYLESFVSTMVPLLPLLRKHYNLRTMLTGEDMDKIDAAVLTEVEARSHENKGQEAGGGGMSRGAMRR
eukprot:3943735-Pyramimonas_sp.AAC.1